LKYAIYISKNGGEATGPFTKKELREAVHSGNVSWDDWAWHKELSEWKPVHAVIPILHVARCGEEIAQFEEERDIFSGLRDGSLLMDDYYWCEGMSEWKQLSTLEISKAALATTAQKDALKAAGLPFDELTTKAQVTALFSAGSNGPATAKQLALLSYLKQPVSENISKKEAAHRIDAIVGGNDPDKFGDWNDDKLSLSRCLCRRNCQLQKGMFFRVQCVSSRCRRTRLGASETLSRGRNSHLRLFGCH
jgi:hypothetical protein